MKGKVILFWGNKKTGQILGEDNVVYFYHLSDAVNSNNIKKDNIVYFDVINEGRTHPRAINIRKTGHGKNHPFIPNLNRISYALENAEMDEAAKGYLLRDIQTIVNYFSAVEDYEWCKNLNVFIPKDTAKKEDGGT